jgi:hypothetical protein
MKHIVVIQNWSRYLADRGVQSDGISIHLTREDRDSYVKKHWMRLEDSFGENLPSTYPYPAGDPIETEVAERQYFHVSVFNDLRIFNCKEASQWML